MLPDHSEKPFQVSQISPDGATLKTDANVPVGVKIVAYIDKIGRMEGNVIAHFDGGIAIEFILTGNRRERIEQKLKWLSENNGEEQRRHARYKPAESSSHITMPDGRVYKCEVMDISLSGAAVATDIMPHLGTYVLLGKMRGRVVRYIDKGIAIEFVRPLNQQSLAEQIK